MIDWKRIQGFQWDGGNLRKNLNKHEMTQAEAEQIFFNSPLLVLEDAAHSIDEQRFHALGSTDDARTLHITFTLRRGGQLIRVISARNMHRKERRIYEQA